MAATDKPTDKGVFAIPSLFQASTKAVITNLDNYEESLWETPENIKLAVLQLMSKRGLITDENIDRVLNRGIKCLDLSNSKVTDESLFKLTSVRHLLKIDLNSFKGWNRSITSAGIISLSKTCRYLQVVYLRRNINLTDDAVKALSENCPMLRELDVGGCTLLTDASLRMLGENSRHLKSLNIIATQATDDGIYKLCIGNCSRTITEIDVSGCKHLTDEAVNLLIQNCSQLRIILFARCPNITENARIALEEKLNSSNGAKMKQVSWTIY